MPSRPLLLIVDGESLRTPGLASAMEGDGWQVRWIRSGEAWPTGAGDPLPDMLLLLEPPATGEGGYAVARRLRERQPHLPVLVISEGVTLAPPAPAPPLAVQAFLDRTEPDHAIASALRRFRPDPKLTTDDLFGQVLEEVGALPERALPPIPPVRSILFPEAGPHPEVAEPLGPSDFTLSGITGVDDPFEWTLPQAKAAPAPSAPQSKPQAPVVPQVPEAREEYGNYFLLEKIAVGGMAELFKAQQRGVQGFQKIVAIKRILPCYSDNEDFVTMFIDEAKLAAQLTHPNIVQIFDLGKAGSSYYIAMEYVNGRDLRTLLKKVREYGAPFPEQVAAFVVMKVAAALDYAHRKRGFDDRELKLVHRDISPQNVIISTEGAVKLVDFGIAKAASKASHTVSGALKGKLLYMSPEQATGAPLDNRSDLYSLGLVLFELLTGERCFQADSELGVLEKVRLGCISDLATLNPRVSRGMAAIVSKALQRNVDHRYPSARFMERELRDYLQRQGTPLTEHDVADYMNALLYDSRENLANLVASRFPVPLSPVTGTHRTLAPAAGPREPAPPRPKAEPPPLPAGPAPSRPRWLLPAILALAVIVVIALAVARWS